MIEPLIVLVGVASVGLAWLNHQTNSDESIAQDSDNEGIWDWRQDILDSWK